MFATTLGLLLFAALSSCDNDWVAPENDECTKQRKSVPIEWHGCEPTFTKVPVCSGACKSYDVVIPFAPYFEKQCACCKSARHEVRKRQLSFECNGRTENHTVFLPIIDECTCVQCPVF